MVLTLLSKFPNLLRIDYIDQNGRRLWFYWCLKFDIQNTLRVVHSPVVEKLPVVDKTLPPNHFYLAKVPSSGQFPVVDKKS